MLRPFGMPVRWSSTREQVASNAFTHSDSKHSIRALELGNDIVQKEVFHRGSELFLRKSELGIELLVFLTDLRIGLARLEISLSAPSFSLVVRFSGYLSSSGISNFNIVIVEWRTLPQFQ